MTQVFQDTFAVEVVNPEKKVFDRIDRLVAKGKTYDCQMTIDVNSELWKVREGETIVVTLATSLTNGPDDGTYRQTNEASLLDTCEYAMHGRVFNLTHKKDHEIEIDVSFGGLLMRLSGDHRHLTGVELDQNIYCLMAKA
mmetsp:Transcript_83441/g.167096  ORF Transcript_83441/g.167096 Transcript_83441/m.167096 type:complete len:140 (+) Transcript_83441:66-485(+)|eukprot:CAMPEP_0171621122 /NCGR_PEP_ID=MMETSP0990-20121206/16415_1 /TAXON_ID=483369 /ORGANISM="non described non described, Strain CCMP2098" /LENGTH=139 /DNA_ID=CAMNT_0012186579 /DNA_START=7 /DNA_END=426 /DNA_ORIENTATION=-